MDSDADGNRLPVGYSVSLRSGFKNRHATADRAAGRPEDDVEAIALGPDLRSCKLLDRAPNERAIRSQELRRRVVAVRLDKVAVIAQVGEQEAVRLR